MKTLHKKDLYLEIEDLLGLKRSRYPRTGKGYSILNTIIKVITSALQRGEEVNVRGFGKFKIRTRPPSRVYVTYFYGQPNGPRALVDLPEKRYVFFQPSKSLIKDINGSPVTSRS